MDRGVPGRVVAAVDEVDRFPRLLARSVEAHVAQQQQGEQRDPLRLRRANVPQSNLPPESQQPRAPAFGGNAGTLRGDLVGPAVSS